MSRRYWYYNRVIISVIGVYFIWNTSSWQSIHRRHDTRLSFKRSEHASRQDPKSHDRGGGLLINLFAIPIDRKSPGYKEKRAFPPGGTETLNSFPRARKGNPADAVATMHRSVTSRWPLHPHSAKERVVAMAHT